MIHGQPCTFMCCNQGFELGRREGISVLKVMMLKSRSGTDPNKVSPRIPFLKRSLSHLMTVELDIFSALADH